MCPKEQTESLQCMRHTRLCMLGLGKIRISHRTVLNGILVVTQRVYSVSLWRGELVSAACIISETPDMSHSQSRDKLTNTEPTTLVSSHFLSVSSAKRDNVETFGCLRDMDGPIWVQIRISELNTISTWPPWRYDRVKLFFLCNVKKGASPTLLPLRPLV